jgi:hypothetical protein
VSVNITLPSFTFTRPLILLAALSFGCGSSSSATGGDGGHEPPGDAGKDSPGAKGDSGEHRDAAEKKDGGGDSGITLGSPITATANTWTWVPFPNAVCGNGTSTGIGVNLTGTPSSRVLLYLEGGGACWSDLTCFNLMTASYISTGYGEAEFTVESTDVTYLAEPGGFFDRTASANPFKDYSYVYVPYCTGDVFAGDAVQEYSGGTVHFEGWKNMGEYLSRIIPTFSGTDRVILGGSSAGGFGAALNWWRVQEGFGSVRVDLIDDSGTAMPDDILGDAGVGLEQTWLSQWNVGAALPPGCTTCAADLSTIYGYYETAFPSHRGALLSYTEDSVLPTFFGISTAQFTEGLGEDIARYFAPTSNLKYFTNDAPGHVLFLTPTLTTSSTTVQQFITQMVTDDPSWANVHP